MNIPKALTLLVVTLATILITSCNSTQSEIPIDQISVDKKTNLYTYTDSKKNVTGNVISNDTDNGIVLKTVEKIENGQRVSCITYFPNGKIRCEYLCDENGEIKDKITWYFDNGNIDEVRPYANGKANGVSKRYNKEGKLIIEQHYKNDEIIKEYKFDENGNKIIPAFENLGLAEIKTGFYEDANSRQTLYRPIVLMKFENKSSNPISEKIIFEGTFIDTDNNEELSSDREYFQTTYEAPLQPNLSRQCKLKSAVGRTSPYAIDRINISCKITVNGTPFKTVKIANEILYLNRIQ